MVDAAVFFQAEHFDILLAVLSFLIQPGYALRPVIFSIRRHGIWEVSENNTEPNQTEPNFTQFSFRRLQQ